MGIVLAGSLFGVVSAILSFLLLDVGIVAAMGIWAASGPISAILAVLASAARPLRPQSAHPRSAHPRPAPALRGEGGMARAG